ncbi:MAG: META domain-containing protein [Muribaculaceae bacterium]|nr:META domain-containing protein [Muribaculaceae bacterium]
MMKKYIHILVCAAAVMGLGSCNMVQNAVTRVTGAAGTPKPKEEQPAAPAKNAEPKKSAQTKPSKQQPLQEIDEKQLAGEWVIVAVGDTRISDLEEMPYITFSDGAFYGSNGCNVLNGQYSVKGSKLGFSHVAATMRFCPDVPFEHEINVVLADGTSYPVKIENKGHETYLYLLSDNGNRRLLQARRHNMGFLNGEWRVTAIGNDEIDDEECNIFFDIAEGKVHGNTGCNYFNGEIFISPDRANAIELSNMGVTRMACPKTAQETAMLVALEQASQAVQKGDRQAALLDNHGEKLITLKRVDKND